MIKRVFLRALIMMVYITSTLAMAQESAADVSNETNEDAFQEHFYEALKQKGIENYDRAITALLVCKELEPANDVIDYELGLNYMYQHKYVQAQPYLEAAISKRSNNKWYLDALLTCYKNQQNIAKAIEVASKLSATNPNYKGVLADLYIEQQEYDKALVVIDEMDASGVQRAEAAQKRSKVIMLQNISALAKPKSAERSSSVNNPIDDYKNQILKQQERTDYKEMLSVSSDALDNFPTQPDFYYLKGVALNKLQEYKMATEVLEEGLGYLLDDKQLENNIFKELMFAYNKLGETEKSNEYQLKIDANN